MTDSHAQPSSAAPVPSSVMAAEASGIVVSGWDPMAQRLKAFSLTGPLHELDQRKTRLDWADASVYHMADVAFRIIDEVTVAMDFDGGARLSDVPDLVMVDIARMAPDRGAEEHRKVAEWVLDQLLAVGQQARQFETSYGVINVEGAYERRVWSFRLLDQSYGDDDEIFLRATDEAINVLVGALDVDVESAQESAELRLASLIRRGRLGEAQMEARTAKLRTIQYAERLRKALDATRRNVAQVDWLNEIPTMIDNALTHIEERFQHERAILNNVREIRDEATDAVGKKQAADLVEIVDECLRRHTTLQARLQRAGAVFRAEQDRQEFSGLVRSEALDLGGYVLTPTLGLPMRQAHAVTETFFAAVCGVDSKMTVRLGDLIDLLTAPPMEHDDLGEEFEDLDLTPFDPPKPFSDEAWAASDGLLFEESEPRRLSWLMEQARVEHPDLPELPHLVALRALMGFGGSLEKATLEGQDHALISIDDGTPMRDPEFSGTDLLVRWVAISRDAAADPPPAHMTATSDDLPTATPAADPESESA